MRRPQIVNPGAGPNVVGIVVCKVDDDWCRDWDDNRNDAEHLEACIRNAVTDWALYSQEGRDAIRWSSFDFNLVDLATELAGGQMKSDPASDPSRLDFYLTQQGIRSLRIQTVQDDNEHVWEFDDILFNGMEIDEDVLDAMDRRTPMPSAAERSDGR